VSGRKEIAREAAVDYFTRAAGAEGKRGPSIFEIMARTFGDVRSAALCSGLWAGAYTTFMKLQAIARDPVETELIVLSRCDPGFRPLLSTHFMLQGNYEGFVRLYDFVEEARFEEDFLQYRIRDIANEFEGYAVEEEGEGLKIVESRGHRTVAVFQPVQLDHEEIPCPGPSAEALEGGDCLPADATEAASDGWILQPQLRSNGPAFFRVLVPRRVSSRTQTDTAASALRVVQGGALRSGSVVFTIPVPVAGTQTIRPPIGRARNTDPENDPSAVRLPSRIEGDTAAASGVCRREQGPYS
jgi:hypothetical protein